MRILLTGADGQVGRCVQDRAADHVVLACSRQQLDITDADQIERVFSEFAPDVVINAAAYTAVDHAEQDAELARAVNAAGPGYLAVACKQADIPLLHLSTDYVFDGSADSPYQVDQQVKPLGVYGKTKAEGEALVCQYTKHLVIRTAWVFSEYGSNFVKTMLRLGKERDQLGIVSDQRGCPTYAGDIADMLLMLAGQAVEEGFNRWGIYHFTGDEEVSWYQFAGQIFAESVQQGKLNQAPKLSAIATSDYPTPAARPAYSVLDNSALLGMIGGVNQNWQKSLKQVISQL